MGSFGVFSALEKEPGKFAAAYAVCGGSNIDAAPKITTPLWIFHGAEDDVVPVRLSKNMYEEMLTKGNKAVRYTEYPGVKHNSWENVSHETSLAKWLFSQQKSKTGDAPGPVKNLTVKKLYNSTIRLQWSEAEEKDPTKEVWYYKIFRNGELIGEVNGGLTEFNDYKYRNNANLVYHVIAVTYLFKESKLSQISAPSD
jgi:hypothetical protein